MFLLASDLIIVGSNCKSASKSIDSRLSKEWKTFVEDSKSKGTIYIAFGTAIHWDGAPQHVIDAFIDAINELEEYRIIFSWNGEFPKNAKSHVKFTKWAPQMAILLHPKTVLFITHGGLKSLKESLCAEIPVILMPMFAEQAHNSKYALKLGIGGILNKFELTKEKFLTTIQKVLINYTFF
uniref:UDP-glucuronosyltransferase n=1 Tax=Panagrolaimus superbus TaxID=310955 RepID=A0A914YT03_9BILA